MSDDVRIWCLRHAESANVVAGAAGALPSAPLTATGRAQARAAAERLRPVPVAAVYASSAVRARHTGSIIAAALRVPLSIMDDLVEAGVGAAEGATDRATVARAAAVLRAWVVDRDRDQRVADGEDGHAVVARVSRVLDVVAADHPGRTAVVVGHVASLTAALAALADMGTEIWGAPLPYAVPFLVERVSGGWRCLVWPGEPTARSRADRS